MDGTPEHHFVGEHGPELVHLRDGDVVRADSDDGGYVCFRCQKDKHRACDEIDCTCCSGDGG